MIFDMEKTYKITLPKGVSVNEIETSVEDGVLSVSVEMARERYMPKDGDFVTCGNCYRLWVIIYKHTEHDPYECCYYYAMKNMGLDNLIRHENYCNAQDTMRPSTEEERQELLDALAKEGKRWNAETKQIEDLPRWRAEKGGFYFFLNSKLVPSIIQDFYMDSSDDLYAIGNYFKTSEAAEKVASQIRDILKNSKAE